jgi:hypothetical protein
MSEPTVRPQIKFFFGTPDDVEKEANSWLAHKPGIVFLKDPAIRSELVQCNHEKAGVSIRSDNRVFMTLVYSMHLAETR